MMTDLDIHIRTLQHSIDSYGKEHCDAQEILEYLEAIRDAINAVAAPLNTTDKE